ncbi:hypothetical protein HPB51_020926 [Rhipicephalus microplus]|uniref:Chitinase n=1 Tax=Rhipicephalus microplus TaxID=6941 RepID=A0A9J6ECL7_RHIMP|nr:hypothetical protein HPB51_020926 [Rhipicephalus microplus]
MAESFVFRNKTMGLESAARRAFSRRTWLIVGVMTSAMLLMCTSVAVFHRRFNLTAYFRHSPAAAAAATEVWDRQSTANMTLRKSDVLERQQRSSSTRGMAVAKKIKPRELVQAKIKRKARAKSTLRRHENSSRGTHKALTRRGAPRGHRDGGEVVDVDQELEILQRPFAERPQVVEDDASPTGRVDAKKKQSIAGTVENVQKSGAPLASSPGVDSSTTSARIEPSNSDFTRDSSKPQEAEGTSSTAQTTSGMPVFSTSSSKFSATPPKRIRMVKKRRKLRRLGTLPASMSSPDLSRSSTVVAGNTTAGTHTTNTGSARAKEEEVTKKEHALNITSKLASGLSSENPATTKERTAATDVEISDASSGNKSSNLSRIIPSSIPFVKGVTFTTKEHHLAETSGGQEPVSKKGTVAGVIGSTPHVNVAGVENSSASEPKSSSAVASSNDDTGTSESNTYDSVSGTSNSSLNEATFNDASLVDVVARGVNKSADDVLEKILNKATKDRRNNSANSAKDSASTAHTSKGVDGGVTWKEGAGNANSTTAVSSAHTWLSTESKESSKVRATTYLTEQNRSTSMSVAARKVFLSTSSATSPQPPAAEPSSTQSSAIPSSEKQGLRSTSESGAFGSSPAASPQSSAAEPSNTQPSTKTSSETKGLKSTSEGRAFVSTIPAAEPSNTQSFAAPLSGNEGIKSTSEVRVFASTSPAAEPSHAQPSAIPSSEKEGLKTETPARELATRRQARKGSPEKLSSTITTSLLKSSTLVPTSDNPAEVIGTSKDAGHPDEIVPETEAAPTSTTLETTTPATTTSTFAYYTGQDEWIPESRRRYIDALSGYSIILKPELRGKAPPAHHVVASNDELIAPGDHASHQTPRSADVSVSGTSGKPEHHGMQARETSKAILREQQPTSKVNVKSAMSELFSSLNEAIREESKHDVGESGEDMLDYGAVPRDLNRRVVQTNPACNPWLTITLLLPPVAARTAASLHATLRTGPVSSTATRDHRKTPEILAKESMENGNSTPTRSPRVRDSSRYSLDADHSGSRAVVTTTEGIELKTSRPDFRRTGITCVYRKEHAGWVSGNTTYGLDTLPYQYCASVVYCCLGLREDFTIEDHGNHSDFKKLAKIKSDSPGLHNFVVIKADKSSAPSFKRLVSGTMHQDIFNLLAVHWMKTRNIDGVYLYWPQMEDSDGSKLVNAFRYLVGSFVKSKLKFGIILPPGTRYFANMSNLKALTANLDGSYDAVLLSPPEMDQSAYTGKLSSPSQALVGEYGKYLGDLAGTMICPMIPFWGKTFKMKAVLQDSGLTLRPVGRGGARMTSREPGKLTFFEFCRELGNSRIVFPSRENAMIGDEYVMFLTPATLKHYLESSTSSRTSWRCLGSWGPEWDDFDGSCGLGRYPLLRTLYEFHKRALNAPGAFSVSKTG